MNFIEEKILKRGDLSNLKFRFPPENNGYLHIGHVKSICLNFGLAEKYNTICNLRFDDTNPIAEKIEFTNSIESDIKWLGYNYGKPKYTSDYFDFIYDCAINLIRLNLAYVDDSTSEEIALSKGTTTLPGINSLYRNRSIDENLFLFNEMNSGNIKEGIKVLRAKIDMSSPNMILRDPIIYRVINSSHDRTGDKWNVYPMYDFAHPISDWIENISDSLCTLEFEVHRPLYNWILSSLNLNGIIPEPTEFARLNIENFITSKRKLKEIVESGIAMGWDDPRMATISGLRRRGYTATALKDFCERVGYTKVESEISPMLLEECLRIDLNKKANRLMGVMDPIKLTIKNWNNGIEKLEIENNPEDLDAGTRLIDFSGNLWIERDDFKETEDKKYHRLKLNSEVRLKGAYVVKAIEIIKDSENNIIEIICEYDPLTKSGMIIERKIKGTIHWVCDESKLNAEIREFSNLNLEKSLNISYAYVEKSSSDCKVDMPIQMMRKGYYVIDKDSTVNKLIFNKTVSLKESYII